jgi:transposase-like protein
MCDDHRDALWRAFPKTLTEFEERFPDEEACRAYWIELRWNGRPACANCNGHSVWLNKARGVFECADCGHQTSLTSGTLLHGTRKPLKLWFRVVFEMSVRRNGISAKDVQRIMGFGSYKTAWHWLHKIRRGLLRDDRLPLEAHIQLDESLIGGKEGEKSMVFIGVEIGGRVRMAHAPNNDEETMSKFVNREIAMSARVTTDGLATYNRAVLGKRRHDPRIQTKAERKVKDALQNCHWAASLVKRWLMGTHHGAVRAKHLQSYLHEFAFRHNRRKTKGVVRIAARALEGLVMGAPLSMRQLIDDTRECRLFA